MFVFGSGVLIGTPQGGTPINFGLAQEVSLNIATSTKALYGQYNFPVAIGSGTRKMTGKAKLARISGQALGALFFGGSTWLLALIFFFGWALNGTFPLFMGTIPSESVDPRYMTTAMALVMGAGEVIGGALSPAIAGWAADRAGLAAPMWIMLGLCITAGTLALGLKETAPARCRAASVADRR